MLQIHEIASPQCFITSRGLPFSMVCNYSLSFECQVWLRLLNHKVLCTGVQLSQTVGTDWAYSTQCTWWNCVHCKPCNPSLMNWYGSTSTAPCSRDLSQLLSSSFFFLCLFVSGRWSHRASMQVQETFSSQCIVSCFQFPCSPAGKSEILFQKQTMNLFLVHCRGNVRTLVPGRGVQSCSPMLQRLGGTSTSNRLPFAPWQIVLKVWQHQIHHKDWASSFSLSA